MTDIKSPLVPSFKPWRTDFKEGGLLICAAAISSAVGISVLKDHWTMPDATQLSLIVGGTMLVSGMAFWQIGVAAIKRGLFRKRGAIIERNAIEDLMPLLASEWKAVANTLAVASGGKAAGDIDLVIRTDKATLAIEIKSPTTAWGCDSYWRRLTGIGIDQRVELAIAQAKRNAMSVSPTAIPMLWLPKAKKFRARYRDVDVVGGDARYFRDSLAFIA